MAGGIQYIIRLSMQRELVPFRQLVELVDQIGGDIVALDMVRPEDDRIIRDLTVVMPTPAHLQQLEDALAHMPGTAVENVSDRTFLMHLGGKIEIQPRVQVKTRADLSHIYTPGVARVVQAIADDPSKAFQLTMKRNTVAIGRDVISISSLPRCRSSSRKRTLRWSASTMYSGQAIMKLPEDSVEAPGKLRNARPNGFIADAAFDINSSVSFMALPLHIGLVERESLPQFPLSID